MNETPQLLLTHHLKALKLPTFLREYDKVAQQCAAEGLDHPRYLLRLSELELIERERRMVERRIREAKFPTIKSLDSFDFLALPSVNKALVRELARCEYITRRENVIALGNSGTGENAHCAWSRPRSLPKGPLRRLCHGSGPGPRVVGGPRRKTIAPHAEEACWLQIAHH